jgi:ferredoxin
MLIRCSFRRVLQGSAAARMHAPVRITAFRSSSSSASAELVSVTFVTPQGQRISVREPAGTTLLEVAHKNHVDMEGACEGSLACSTCHVIVEDRGVFDSLPPATEDEEDMLDLAFGLTDTSRLGCQIKLTPELDGFVVKLPSATRNMSVDGFKPKPH